MGQPSDNKHSSQQPGTGVGVAVGPGVGVAVGAGVLVGVGVGVEVGPGVGVGVGVGVLVGVGVGSGQVQSGSSGHSGLAHLSLMHSSVSGQSLFETHSSQHSGIGVVVGVGVRVARGCKVNVTSHSALLSHGAGMTSMTSGFFSETLVGCFSACLLSWYSLRPVCTATAISNKVTVRTITAITFFLFGLVGFFGWLGFGFCSVILII